MILGASRTPFSRPSAASGAYVPQLPNTGFYSHFHPLTQVTRSMGAESMYRPSLNPNMGPHALPDVPMPAPAVVPAAAPMAPPIPKAGGTAGFGGSGFGSTGGTQGLHSHMDPYMVMRQGVIPGVFPSGMNIRAGVRNASQRVHRSMPFQTAALPPPPPPPVMVPAAAMAPAVPASGVKGLMGVLSDHLGLGGPWWRRRRHMSPAMVASGTCEKLGPRMDGTFVTICNGRVTEVSDAAGNVHQNPFA